MRFSSDLGSFNRLDRTVLARHNRASSSRRLRQPAQSRLIAVLRRRPVRILICFATMLNLLIWPAPGITLKSFEPASALTSTVSSTVIAEASLAFSELRSTPVVFVPVDLKSSTPGGVSHP